MDLKYLIAKSKVTEVNTTVNHLIAEYDNTSIVLVGMIIISNLR